MSLDPHLTNPHRILVLDGAMGTELARLGHDTGLPLWSAGPLLRHPKAVTALHAAYLQAGADVLTANTFRTNPRTFRRAGLGLEAARAATHRAVACAREAIARAGRPALIAGSLAPVEDCYHPERVPAEAELTEEHGLLAGWLAEAGVDVALLETMGTEREARAAAEAAAQAGLPVWGSFLTGPAPDRLLSGESLTRAARTAIAAGALAVGVNCVRPDPLTAALAHLREAVEVPLVAYANGGCLDEDGTWHVDPALTVADWEGAVQAWSARGARLVGGCCGAGPTVTAALRNAVDKLALAPYDPKTTRATREPVNGD